MKYRKDFCTFGALLVAILWVSSVHAQCRFTEISPENISSEKLETQIKTWQKQNPDADSADLVCCLPGKWRKSYVVVPESKSLQCSGPKFPRVILFDPGSSKDPLRIAISFVAKQVGETECDGKFSGDNSNKNLEMIEFNKNAAPEMMFQMVHLQPHADVKLHTNSFVCLDCHRTPDGMKPVMADLGSQFSNLGAYSQCASAQEKSQQQNWMNELRQLAMKSKQRPYNCLLDIDAKTKAPDASAFAETNTNFTHRLALAQDHHVAARLQRLPEYNRYKFSLLAAALSCVTEGESEFSALLPPKAPTFDARRFSGSGESEASLQCLRSDGLCGTRIPSVCSDLSRRTWNEITEARKQSPEAYGKVLAQTFYEKGRSALLMPAQVRQFAQMRYLIGIQPGAARAGLDELMGEYPGPNSINFKHLASLMIEQDPELAKIVPQNNFGGKNLKAVCQKLVTQSQKEPEGNSQAPVQTKSTNTVH